MYYRLHYEDISREEKISIREVLNILQEKIEEVELREIDEIQEN